MRSFKIPSLQFLPCDFDNRVAGLPWYPLARNFSKSMSLKNSCCASDRLLEGLSKIAFRASRWLYRNLEHSSIESIKSSKLAVSIPLNSIGSYINSGFRLGVRDQHDSQNASGGQVAPYYAAYYLYRFTSFNKSGRLSKKISASSECVASLYINFTNTVVCLSFSRDCTLAVRVLNSRSSMGNRSSNSAGCCFSRQYSNMLPSRALVNTSTAQSMGSMVNSQSFIKRWIARPAANSMVKPVTPARVSLILSSAASFTVIAMAFFNAALMAVQQHWVVWGARHSPHLWQICILYFNTFHGSGWVSTELKDRDRTPKAYKRHHHDSAHFLCVIPLMVGARGTFGSPGYDFPLVSYVWVFQPVSPATRRLKALGSVGFKPNHPKDAYNG